jgi:CHAD domain-containing protein
VLRHFFERMLAREEDVRKGEDPEDVHQMRVATRRLRASLQVVEELYEPGLARRLRRGLRRAARALGDVRDHDVLLAHLTEFAAGLPEGERSQIDPLVAALAAERAAAREELLRELAGERYGRLKRRAARFLTSPGEGLAELPETGAPPRVRDVAGSAIWRRYEALRAFEVAIEGGSDGALHQARIAGKRLRYTLELFAPALGPRADELLVQLADLQDHLGQIQDGVAARERIAALGMAELPSAQAYLAHLEARRDALAADLPRVWGRVAGGTYRRRLMELIVKL